MWNSLKAKRLYLIKAFKKRGNLYRAFPCNKKPCNPLLESVCERQNQGHCSMNTCVWKCTSSGQPSLISAIAPNVLANGKCYWNRVEKALPLLDLYFFSEKGFKMFPCSGAKMGALNFRACRYRVTFPDTCS